ncbi:BCCT family transporter [Proteiniclasticum sp. QWL-01]|uniref:glycine betaine uptake BCCT transporter n=1 Tax=Proteiniclasticum sp. QWL-01 TaxID=3036945 RepID=UPI00241116D0|nr:BCCT family transporter [Proteiniclasticum sp. QWL-01]WFF73166.1 BCCT family transporter [Proteiniclasticum sp. QWL-01]
MEKDRQGSLAPKQDNTVYFVSLVIVLAISAAGLLFSGPFGKSMDTILQFLQVHFGWLYLFAMLAFVVVALGIAFSKYGKLKLGPDDSVPDYSTKSWFAMLFGAGMGIGLVFWGIAEPLSHLVAPMGLEPGSNEAATFAIQASFKHWGFHPWANYTIIGLALGYFQFRKGYPGLISSIFVPLIGEKGVRGPIGKLIDILAVFATVAGVATSLGLGTMQINSGLNKVFGIPNNSTVQLIIIAIITVIFIWTAVAGIEKGIALLGDINLYLAGALLVASFLVGPKLLTLNTFTEGMGAYIQNFISDSLHLNLLGDNGWINGWTVFYWAWWIAWAPFVGSFIARISRGRTFKEFILGVTVAPAVTSMVWFAIFGAMGIDMKNKIGLEKMAEIAKVPETALFEVFSQYPLGQVLSFIAIFLLITFFVTSANSATFVLGMFTQGGDLNPSNSKKITWGLIQSALATSLLLAGGLVPLQTASVIAAFPFIFIMFFAIASLFKALREETL